MPDVDIDFLDRKSALDKIKHIKASRYDKESLVAHNTGVYLQSIPNNPVNNLATIPYKEAEARGYFKIDFLNVNVYEGVKDEEHLKKLMEQEPIWDLLHHESFVDQLFHLNGYTSTLKEINPRSVEQLAAVLAMIRPAKKHLIGKDWNTVMKEVWVKPEDGAYYFKHGHAIAYAVAIVVQMNLICESVTS